VDTTGLHDGGFTLRWQGIKGGGTVAKEEAYKDVRLVKISDLKTNLPTETEWVGIDARKKQLTDRATSFAHRLGN
jgi:hypothetical protein